MGVKISLESLGCPTVMKVGRQHIPESRSWHQEAAAHTSQTGARYSQVHSGTGRVQCPAWRVQTDHGAHVGQCIIGVQGLIEEAHQSVTHSLVDAPPVQPPMLEWHGHAGAYPSPGEQHSSGTAAVPGVQQQTGPPTESYSSPPWTSPRTAQPWRRCPCPGSVWCCWWCTGDRTWCTWRSGSSHACLWWSPWWCWSCRGRTLHAH